MDCLEVETGVDDLVAAFVEKSTQALRPALIDSTRMIGWLRPILCCCPLKRLQLHALDIELDNVDPRQSERIDRIFWIVTVLRVNSRSAGR